MSKSVSLNTTLLLCAAFLIGGLSVGFLSANYLNRNSESGTPPVGQTDAQPVTPQAVTQNGTMQDVAKAIENARSNPENFEAQMQAGSMYAQINRFDKAEEFLDAAAKITSLDFEKTVLLANAFFDIRKFDKAQPLYQKALKERPDDVDARSDLGATFRDAAAPDYAAAIREFETVLAKNPKHEPTLYNLGATYLKMGEKKKAEDVLQRLETAAPGNELAARLRKEISGQ